VVRDATESSLAELPADTSSSDGSPRAGEILDGKYELVRKVGEGGMGEVYEARHQLLGRRFAVKLLRRELLNNERMLKRFSREVLAVSRIENDHLVPALDCGRAAQGEPYYVMDFLRGADLRQVLRREAPLATQRAVRLVIDACRGLHSAHAAGLVHRDLKPENVFVIRCDNGEEAARVLDFGLVQLDSGNSAPQLGALVGTVRYMAPEQARADRRVDRRADVYALGAILYECLTGKPPHAGTSAEEVLFNRMNAAPESLAEQRPELSRSLVSVVQRALANAPEERFDGALEFSEALLPFAGPGVHGLQAGYALRAPSGSASDALNETFETQSSKPPRRATRAHPLRWAAFGAGVTAVLASVLHFAGRRGPPFPQVEERVAVRAPRVTRASDATVAAPAPPPGTIAPAATLVGSSEPKRAVTAPARSLHVGAAAVAPLGPGAFLDHDNPYERASHSP
jgi:eukaryotic-like serine/threonine-protein kinase